MENNKDKKPEIKDVFAILNYGTISSNGQRIFWSVFISLWATAFIIAGIVCIIDGTLVSEFEKGNVIGGILAVAGAALLVFPGIYILLEDYKVRKNLQLWLDDAVLVRASVVTRGTNKSWFASVKFRYNDKVYVYTAPESLKYFHGNCFSLYAGNGVKLYYSPKYEQVMFMKKPPVKNDKISF